jgi:hypothetical protein
MKHPLLKAEDGAELHTNIREVAPGEWQATALLILEQGGRTSTQTYGTEQFAARDAAVIWARQLAGHLNFPQVLIAQ